ncbi:hypothetical protein DIPPA_19868 [Diplonema papillatum]|nr:hypothetical protein DIPPA_19868 [Diplonema papillatum]
MLYKRWGTWGSSSPAPHMAVNRVKALLGRISDETALEVVQGILAVAPGGPRTGFQMDNVYRDLPAWAAVKAAVLRNADDSAAVALVVVNGAELAPIFVNKQRLAAADYPELFLVSSFGTPLVDQARDKVHKAMADAAARIADNPGSVASDATPVQVPSRLRCPVVAFLLGYPAAWYGGGTLSNVHLVTVTLKAHRFSFSVPPFYELPPSYLPKGSMERTVVPATRPLIM